MRIKEEYLDTKICCPFTRQHIYCRFIDKEIYNHYYNKGYAHIFETDYTNMMCSEIEWTEILPETYDDLPK